MDQDHPPVLQQTISESHSQRTHCCVSEGRGREGERGEDEEGSEEEGRIGVKEERRWRRRGERRTEREWRRGGEWRRIERKWKRGREWRERKEERVRMEGY